MRRALQTVFQDSGQATVESQAQEARRAAPPSGRSVAGREPVSPDRPATDQSTHRKLFNPGATDIVEQRGDEAVDAVLELTGGIGVDATLECAGTGQSMDTALRIARPRSMVGAVGIPHGDELPFPQMFSRNVGVLGGPAPVHAYMPELLPDVLDGSIDPGRVFDFATDLDGVAEAYAAMDERRAIKSLLRVGAI